MYYFLLVPAKINMNLLFWYLVKSDANARHCTVAHTGQVTLYRYTRNTQPYITGRPVYVKLAAFPLELTFACRIDDNGMVGSHTDLHYCK